jgi:tetratricopeptide (TPR) repeat protein/TolB-like protein
MRSLSKPFALFLSLLGFFASKAPAQTQSQPATPGGRVILVLPFDNRSGNTSLNWIGDSFPDTLNKRLASAGFLTISHDDRLFAYDHLGLPPDFRPTRATTIRIAQQLDANFIVVGSYNVQGNTGIAGGEKISIKARILSIDDLRLSPPLQDGAELSRLFDAENAIAWKAAKLIDSHFAVAEQTFLSAAGAVPLPAFEDYIRGIDAPTPAERLKRLQGAVSLAPSYSAALLALGKEQYAERDYPAAAATLTKVTANNSLALEANFYLGLSNFNSANYAAAQQAFDFIASRLPLPEVVNDQGVALARQGKDGADLFQHASQADPSDEDYHYNLAVALFRRGDTAGALREAEAAIKLKPADNEALDLRTHLKAAVPGARLTASQANGFTPVERIRRNYSEASYRQAAFQLDQLRAMRMAMLPPAQRVSEYIAMARDYLSHGQLPEAETQLQAALQTNPNSAEAHAALAQLRTASNNHSQARDEAKTSIILKPTAAAFLTLAQLDIADKQLNAAAQDVSQALHLEPHNAQAIALKLSLQQRGQSVP